MARKRYSAEEIIKELRVVEVERDKGVSIEFTCRKIGANEVTLHS